MFGNFVSSELGSVGGMSSPSVSLTSWKIENCIALEAAYRVDTFLPSSLGQPEAAKAPVNNQDIVGLARQRHLGEPLYSQLHWSCLLQEQASQKEGPEAVGLLLKEACLAQLSCGGASGSRFPQMSVHKASQDMSGQGPRKGELADLLDKAWKGPIWSEFPSA